MKILVRSFPIIEEMLVSELRAYLGMDRFAERYPNFGNPRVDSVHPFALWLDKGGYDPEMVPSVTIAAGTDAKTPDLLEFRDQSITTLTADDMEALGAGDFDISAEDKQRLESALAVTGVVYGVSNFAPRRDQVALEVWADSVEIKNRLYNVVEGFLLGRVDLWKQKQLFIRAETISGQRGNNYNLDFGRILFGGMVSVAVDYWVVETVYDTEITAAELDVLHSYAEVANG